MTESRGVLNFFLSEVRNMFVPRRGRPGSEGDATPVITPDIHWAFFFHPFVWVCMFPHMAINVSIFAVLYNSLCAVTFSPLSWIFIRLGSWSLNIAGDLQLYNPNPVLSEVIPNAWQHKVNFSKHVGGQKVRYHCRQRYINLLMGSFVCSCKIDFFYRREWRLGWSCSLS